MPDNPMPDNRNPEKTGHLRNSGVPTNSEQSVHCCFICFYINLHGFYMILSGFYMILYGFYMILFGFYVILYGFYLILFGFYMFYIVFI